MQINIKNYIFPLIIISGFAIFVINVSKLNLNYKKFYLEENKNKIIKSNKKELVIEQKQTPDLVENPINQNSNNLKEIIIKVNKGQTFSEILNDFNLDNKKKI